MRIFATAVLFFVVTVAAAAAQPVDLAPVPDGWFAVDPGRPGATPASYIIGVDPGVIHDGHPSAYIGSRPSLPANASGTLMQTISAERYRGKRVRISGSIKTKNAAFVSLWMRVDDAHGIAGFDNMGNRPITGSTDWKSYTVVLDVPDNATAVSFGFLAVGAGEGWLNDVAFDVVTKATPPTGPQGSLPIEPQHLTF